MFVVVVFSLRLCALNVSRLSVTECSSCSLFFFFFFNSADATSVDYSFAASSC